MSHIPSAPIGKQSILTLEQCLSANHTATYDTVHWVYYPRIYCDYRYLLGTRGANPLICIGINPSTAQPGALDNTLKSVERLALFNGFDSFLMCNVSAQRATSPDDMDCVEDPRLHAENIKTFAYILSQHPQATVWAAWGTVIEKRTYLFSYLCEMVKTASKFGAKWVTAGKLSAAGHPHHPLYLKKDTVFAPFDPIAYCDAIEQKNHLHVCRCGKQI